MTLLVDPHVGVHHHSRGHLRRSSLTVHANPADDHVTWPRWSIRTKHRRLIVLERRFERLLYVDLTFRSPLLPLDDSFHAELGFDLFRDVSGESLVDFEITHD